MSACKPYKRYKHDRTHKNYEKYLVHAYNHTKTTTPQSPDPSIQ
jgi:hypothetical protein